MCSARKGSFCRVVAPFKQLIKLYPWWWEVQVGSWKNMNSSWKCIRMHDEEGEVILCDTYTRTHYRADMFVWYLLGIKENKFPHQHTNLFISKYTNIGIHIHNVWLCWNIPIWGKSSHAEGKWTGQDITDDSWEDNYKFLNHRYKDEIGWIWNQTLLFTLGQLLWEKDDIGGMWFWIIRYSWTSWVPISFYILNVMWRKLFATFWNLMLHIYLNVLEMEMSTFPRCAII